MFVTNGWGSFCAFSSRFGVWGMMLGLAINNCRSLGHQSCVCQTGTTSIIVWTWFCTILHKTLGIKEKGGKHIGCVLIQLASFVVLYQPPCCVGLVSKKDNFLADSIDVMKADLSGDNQEETVSNSRFPAVSWLPISLLVYSAGKVFNWNSFVLFQQNFPNLFW